jgi:hypothetical protein
MDDDDLLPRDDELEPETGQSTEEHLEQDLGEDVDLGEDEAEDAARRLDAATYRNPD